MEYGPEVGRVLHQIPNARTVNTTATTATLSRADTLDVWLAADAISSEMIVCLIAGRLALPWASSPTESCCGLARSVPVPIWCCLITKRGFTACESGAPS